MSEVICKLCGGLIGPDITGRPMCYGCAEDRGPTPRMNEIGRYAGAQLARRDEVLREARNRLACVSGWLGHNHACGCAMCGGLNSTLARIEKELS